MQAEQSSFGGYLCRVGGTCNDDEDKLEEKRVVAVATCNYNCSRNLLT